MTTRLIATGTAVALAACIMSVPSGALAKGAATPNMQVNLSAQFTAKVPVYRTDGEPGTGFDGFEHDISMPTQQYCVNILQNFATCTPTFLTRFTCLCVTAAPKLAFDYHTRCEAAHIDLSFIAPELDFPELTFPGALRLYTDVALGVTLPLGGIIGNVTLPPITVLTDQALGYVLRDADQAAVEEAAATLDPLLSDPATVLALLGENGLLGLLLDENGNLNVDLMNLPPELIDQIEQLLPFLVTVSPVFLPPFHAYHEACRTEEEVDFNVQFRKTATYVQTSSGNTQLNFKAWLPLGNFFGLFDSNIHFQANDKKGVNGITRAQGLLLSRTALFFIDLGQLDGRPGNAVDAILKGSGVPVNACMTFLPWNCFATTLKSQ